MINNKYVYLCLGNGDLGLFKLQGPGLANMMFVAARAYQWQHDYGIPMIAPTWAKLSIGPFLRSEKDKRLYFGLFNSYGIKGLKKLWLINHVTHDEQQKDDFLCCYKGVMRISGLGNYFQDLDQKVAREYFEKIIPSKVFERVGDLSDAVAVHVRLGDYSADVRTPLDWFVQIVQNISRVNDRLRFLVFSDGSDDELTPLLQLPRTSRAFYGSSLADMVAISRCRLVIASDSTFSAWGGYLTARPVLFRHRHFPPLYKSSDNNIEYVLGDVCELPTKVVDILNGNADC